jgi:glycolate oxidase iron-sulfur subunit
MDPIQVVLRQAIGAPATRSLPARLGFGMLTDLGRLRLAIRLLALYQRSGLQRLVRVSGLLRPLGLAEAEAMLPERVSASPLVPDGRTVPADPPATGRVAFFAGCVMSTALAELDRATIRVLGRSGCDVALTRGQGCCGALHAHAGDLATARDMFRRNVAAFEGSAEPVVSSAAGCSAMLKDYAHHLRDDPEWAERAAAFSARVVDATELLAARELPFRRRLDAPVVYQDACHLAHAQRVTAQPRALLKGIPGLELREMAEPGLCCGSAGVYNLTNPTQSRQLQARKVERVLATGARIVATANPGCLLQLRAGLEERGSRVEVRHVVELLDEATAP